MFEFMDMDFNSADSSIGTGPYIPPASECMRCGMCVNVCPTYKLSHSEQETPRSRVRTLSKLLEDAAAISAEEHEHLDNCLQCRACEPACPSHMQYAELFDQAQAKLPHTPNGLGRLAFWLIAHKRWFRRTLPLLSIYLKSGVQAPLRKSGLLKKIGLANAEALLTKPDLTSLKAIYPTTTIRKGSVALFTGCVAEAFDRETLLASIKLLNKIGFDVYVPTQQGCCGAIHQHNGHSAEAFITRNIGVFNSLQVDAVVHTASGCGAMLSEYPGEDAAGILFRQRLTDINEFLLQHWPDDLKLKSADINVAVHEPCSQRNLLKNSQTVYDLLAKIPGIRIEPLADNQTCCGAGGSYMLTHPENAGALRQLKSNSVHASEADCLISSNFGCTYYMNAELPETIKFQHPVNLLAGYLN